MTEEQVETVLSLCLWGLCADMIGHDATCTSAWLSDIVVSQNEHHKHPDSPDCILIASFPTASSCPPDGLE